MHTFLSNEYQPPLRSIQRFVCGNFPLRSSRYIFTTGPELNHIKDQQITLVASRAVYLLEYLWYLQYVHIVLQAPKLLHRQRYILTYIPPLIICGIPRPSVAFHGFLLHSAAFLAFLGNTIQNSRNSTAKTAPFLRAIAAKTAAKVAAFGNLLRLSAAFRGIWRTNKHITHRK